MKTNKAKNVVINGVSYTPVNRNLRYINANETIYDLYEKPSQEKVDEFNKREKRLYMITALRGNSHTFSIFGQVKDNKGRLKNVHITAWNNYIEM